MDSAPRVVLSSAPDLDTAKRLGRRLVEGRLAACVQLVPGALSIYSWEDQLQEDSEVLLLVKTQAALVPRIEALLAAEHPYDTPECVSLPTDRVESRYAAWLLAWTGSSSTGDFPPASGAEQA